MSRTVIIYRSKYGAARRYAGLLAEKLNGTAIENHRLKADSIGNCDNLIVCGGIYASGISGISFLKKNYEYIRNIKTAVFAVGASPYDEKAIEELKRHNLAGELSEIPLYYGRGSWNEEIMTLKDRALCNLLKKMVAKKDPSSYELWEKAMMDSFGRKCDWVDEKYLKPLLKYYA